MSYFTIIVVLQTVNIGIKAHCGAFDEHCARQVVLCGHSIERFEACALSAS